jgi:hypothetical protein
MADVTAENQQPQLVARQSGASDLVRSLFQPVGKGPLANPNPHNAPDPIVRRGSLISFSYLFMKRDPYPMVIVTDVMYGSRIRGVNLNYLTFHDIKLLLEQYGDNRAFSYKSIKHNPSFLAALEAFREYKWMGVRQLRKLNSDFLLQTIEMARSYDPSQMNAMRRAVQEQIRQQVNPKAEEIAKPETLYTQQPGAQQPRGTVGTIPTIPTVPTTPASQPVAGGENNQ